MAVTQYIGSRYVPLFADPIDWDITRAYEPLTIVYYQGNSYTSKQAVPTGIDVTNTTYWALTGNYNSQVEQYRREVQTFDGRITANAQAIADETTARMSEDTAIRALITALNTDLESEESAREAADTQIRTDFAAADTQVRADFAAADAQIRTDFAAADTALGARIDGLAPVINARVPKRSGKKFLLLGDSWGSMQDGALYNDIVAINDFAFAKNFSASGAGIANLTTQVDNATSDTSFDNNDIDVIYIICGTNNVFWNREITRTDALSVGNYIRAAFPNAEIHYFPNIARVHVNEAGRNTYMNIFNGLCYESDIVLHTQQMTLLAYAGYFSFVGTDTYGVQHLSVSGCANFAYWICSLANGGDFSNYQIEANIPMQFASDSSMSGNIGLHQFRGTPNGGAFIIHASELTYNAGYSSSNKGTLKIEIPETGNSSFIAFPRLQYSGGLAFINTYNTAAFVTRNDGSTIQLPLNVLDYDASSVDIYMPIPSLFEW